VGDTSLWSDKLLSAVMQRGYSTDWPSKMKEAFEDLFGSDGGRYPSNAKQTVTLRAPEMPASGDDTAVPFASLIHPSNPNSGTYGGMSIAISPADNLPCLVSFGVGTNGLAPDEYILGRSGHARKVKALCEWLNRTHTGKNLLAWAKHEPSRIDQSVPSNIVSQFGGYSHALKRYGNVLYGIFGPQEDINTIREAITAFLDLMFEERGVVPLAAYKDEAERIKQKWFECLMPEASEKDVLELLGTRRYVILQGPPGTGKTRMAQELMKNHYGGRGRTIQFHANTTYEDFVGGLAPLEGKSELGFRFAPKKGHLSVAAEEALKDSKPYLLHVDEINRADMSKVLGEAIYLLEPDEKTPREITLSYDFGEPFKSKLRLPENLHIIGTMNSADRSLAVVDVAVRRRFAFKKIWPQMRVVSDGGCETMQGAFRDLVSIFVEHANDDSFDLMPGHSYFLEKQDSAARQRLKVTLKPLLEEYLAQGYVASFAEPLRSYVQWIDSL
jgi:5-methylcytosine-specific restriction enzyme B